MLLPDPYSAGAAVHAARRMLNEHTKGLQRGRIMNTTTGQLLKLATSGLTGRREADIVYLNEQIAVYGSDPQIAPVLRNILGSIMISEIGERA